MVVLVLYLHGPVIRNVVFTVQAAVLVAHTAIGPHDPFIQQIIIELAQAGYVAFALDMYGAADIVTGVLVPPAICVYRWKEH